MSRGALEFEHWKAMHLWNEILGWPWPQGRDTPSPVRELSNGYWLTPRSLARHRLMAGYGSPS